MLDDRVEGFRVRTIRTGDHAVITVHGEIDLSTADQLRTALEAASDGCAQVEVDLEGTTFMDSSGLAVLVDAHLQRDPSHRLVVRNPSAVVRQLLDVSGVAQVLDVRAPGADSE